MYFLARGLREVVMHQLAFMTLGPQRVDTGYGRSIEQQVNGTWVSFARTGDPQHESIPSWPAYDTERRATLCFDFDCHVVDDPWGRERQLWDGFRWD